MCIDLKILATVSVVKFPFLLLLLRHTMHPPNIPTSGDPQHIHVASSTFRAKAEDDFLGDAFFFLSVDFLLF